MADDYELELDKGEQRVASLLRLGGAEIPDDDKRSEEEARSAARKAAKLIQQKGYAVIDVKSYDAWWEGRVGEKLKELGAVTPGSDALRVQVESLKRELQTVREDAKADVRAVGALVTKAQQKEQDARRQVDECQKRANQYVRELQDLRARSADTKELARVQRRAEDLERDLETARKDVFACSVFVKNARAAEAEARRSEADTKKQIEACSNLVTRLKSEGLMLSPAATPTPSQELVQLQSQVKDLTFKVATAQAVARACENLRGEELEFYEKRRANSKMSSMSRDFTYTVVAGLLVGGVATMVGALVLRKFMEPEEPSPPPLPPPAPPPLVPLKTTHTAPKRSQAGRTPGT